MLLFYLTSGFQFTYWFTTVASWGDWKEVAKNRAAVIKFINKECELLKISYILPLLPIYQQEALSSVI